jgi:DNA repair exonuclease SbcCD ATPase subunit
MIWVVLVSFSSLPSRLSAQETPAAAAERQEAEERYKRMSADIEDLKTTFQSFQQRLNEQREEIKRLNEELAKVGSTKDLATRDDFKHLADKIREVDERRLADNKAMSERLDTEFANLKKILSVPVKPGSSSPPPTPTKPPIEPKTGNERGYEYTIRANDNPHVIAAALAKQGVKITSKQIIDANPKVDWYKLRIGQKIFIPAPAQP